MSDTKPVILLVEDDGPTAKLIKTVLENGAGFTVVIAATVAEAWKYFREQRFVAIIMDGYLAHGTREETTLQLIAEIKKSGYTGPIFAASSDLVMRIEQIRHGCTGELDKLYCGATWPSIVKEALARRSGIAK